MEEEKGRPAFYNKLMKLHIYNITQDDLGTYKCLAKNSQGETSGEIELYGKFGLLHICILNGKTRNHEKLSHLTLALILAHYSLLMELCKCL